jgi:hypothetical protein
MSMSVLNMNNSSSLLNKNMKKNVLWKGKTFNQIASSIQMNKNSMVLTNMNLKKPMPLKIYRKEIASVSLTQPKYQRTGISIDEYNRPNGSIISHSSTNLYGNNFTLDAKDANYVNNTTYHPGICTALSSGGVCLTPEQNAKKRVRTNGTLKKNYFTTNKEYLASRNQTFGQNQYNYLRTGVNGKPGTANTLNNIYSPQDFYLCVNDISNCNTQVYYKPNNSKFAQQGAVSSSALTSRNVYDAVSSNTMKFRTSYGSAVANAMAYNVFDNVYTVKDKIGYPLPKTPVFNKYSGAMSCKTCYVSKR